MRVPRKANGLQAFSHWPVLPLLQQCRPDPAEIPRATPVGWAQPIKSGYAPLNQDVQVGVQTLFLLDGGEFPSSVWIRPQPFAPTWEVGGATPIIAQ